MKVVQLKNYEKTDRYAPFEDWEALSGTCIMPAAPDRGVSYDEARKCIRLLDKLDDFKVEHPDGTGTLLLEDADHKFLLDRIKARTWPFVDPRWVQLIDRVEAAAEPGSDGIETKQGEG